MSVLLIGDWTALAEPVAHALVHFLWQGSLVGLLLGGAFRLMRGRQAAPRYRCACLALLLMLSLPVVTAVWFARNDVRAAASAGAIDQAGAQSALARSDSAPAPAANDPDGSLSSGPGIWSAETLAEWVFRGPGAALIRVTRGYLQPAHAPWIVGLWLFGVLLVSALHLGGWFQVQRMRCETEPVSGEWRERADRLCRRLGVRQTVRVLRSTAVEIPAVIGALRPVILLPVSALSGLPPWQLECILAHELAHIRRRDHLVNLLQIVAETLLFYHPAVWWVSRQIRLERENCCDDIASELAGSRIAYARALVDLEELRLASPRLALGADGGSLLRRVQRLVGGQQMSNHANRSFVAGILAIVIVLIGSALLTIAAQTRFNGEVDLAPGISSISSSPVDRSRATGASDRRDPTEVTTPDERERATTVTEKQGDWTAERDGDQLALELHGRQRKDRWNLNVRAELHEFSGLDFTEHANFSLKREAGTFRFEGEFTGPARKAEGDGTFTFTGDRQYLERLEKLGIRGLDEHRLLVLATEDLRSETVAELQEMGYGDIGADKLVAVAIFKVTPDYIRELERMGYEGIDLDQLIAMRVHNVDREFIAEMKTGGFQSDSVDDLIAWRVHNLDPEYIAGLEAAGVRIHDTHDALAMKIHGLTGKDIEQMRDQFGADLDAEQILALRIHGVDHDYAASLKNAGLGDLPAEELLAMKIHGITPDTIHDVQALGYDLDAEEILAWKIHGVTADYIQELAELGYEKVSKDNLLKMRIHRVTARWIRHLHKKGLDHLSADDLIKLRISGVEL
jgi:beta-lactamase regulating signal transducer with metallopeptidase domain